MTDIPQEKTHVSRLVILTDAFRLGLLVTIDSLVVPTCEKSTCNVVDCASVIFVEWPICLCLTSFGVSRHSPPSILLSGDLEN